MTRSVEVVKAGPLSTVQDLGRRGVQHLGFSPSGAVDAYALTAGNRLLGNDPALAAVEMTLGGASFRFHAAAAIAVTGAEAPLALDGQPLAPWRTHAVPAGALLQVGAAARGVRSYLCVAGGIDVPPVYGSRATDLLAGIGGLEGRALRAGDRLPIGAPPAVPPARLARVARPLYQRLILVRVAPGPQDGAFTRQSRETFFTAPYRVSPRADRTGLFLEGPRLQHESSADILSEGVTAGSIQTPATGQPLILLAEHRSVGGYAKIGTVCRADLPLLGQARPGDLVLCVPVTHVQAQQAYVAMERLTACLLDLADDGDGTAPDITDWLDAVDAAAAASIADERLPLIRSDLAALAALLRGGAASSDAAHGLRLSGQVIAPDDATAVQSAIHAPAGGTLLVARGEGRNLPVGAVAAAIWSPGALTLLSVGYPVRRLTWLYPHGAPVTADDVLGRAGFALPLTS